MGFYVLLGFILAVIDLCYFLLQFLNQAVGMPFRVFLARAKSIDYVIIIVSDVPNPVWRFEFITFISFGFESLDLLRQLYENSITLSTSDTNDLFDSYLMTPCILTEVEYLA